VLVFIGTYTRGSESRGIYVFDLDAASGALRQVAVADVDDPSYLALAATGRALYSVNESAEGGVSAFSVDAATGRLDFINRVASHGADPAHLSVDPSGRWLLVANYTGGTIATFPIQPDGSLGEAAQVIHHTGSGPNPKRQEGPHPHMIVTDPAGEFVLVPDLGLDAVVAYRLDTSSGQLVAAPEAGGRLAPGAGPRHVAFSHGYAYVLNELGSTVVAHRYTDGRLEPLHTISTLPSDFDGDNTTAAIHVVPSGRFVYASNRGHHSLACFEVDPSSGELTPRGHTSIGGTPRDFNIDPTGTFLLAANQANGTIVTFRADPTSGALQPTGHVAQVPRPVCVLPSANA
jgi:6-phosphogluconolactonase